MLHIMPNAPLKRQPTSSRCSRYGRYMLTHVQSVADLALIENDDLV